MHTTLKLNNLYFIARETAFADQLKDNFKQLTDEQRNTLVKIFKELKKPTNLPKKTFSQKDITDITNCLSGVGEKRDEGCWSKFKRFILSFFRLRISTESIQKKAQELPLHFSKHKSYPIMTTLELANDIQSHGLETDQSLTHLLTIDWKRTQSFDQKTGAARESLFLIEDEFKPLLMNLHQENYESILPNELKTLLNDDKEALQRVALFLTQGIGTIVLEKLASKYPDLWFKQDQYFKFYFEKKTAETILCIELLFKGRDSRESKETGDDVLTVLTINLERLDSIVTLDFYSTS